MGILRKDQPRRHQEQPQEQRGEVVRRDPFQPISSDPAQLFARNPFQLMRQMLVDPFQMMQLSPSAMFGRDVAWNPDFEVQETNDAFVIKADMPGLKSDDLDVSLRDNQLMISGKREQESEKEEGRYYAYERSYGSFTRSFTLPDSADLDKIRSDLEDGVLTLVVPKKAGASAERRKIQVGSGSKS